MLRIPAFFRPPFAGSQTSFPEVQIPHPDKNNPARKQGCFIWSGREDCSRHCCAMLVPQALICFAYRRSFARLSLVVEPRFPEVQIPHPDKKQPCSKARLFLSGRDERFKSICFKALIFIAFYTSIQSKFFQMLYTLSNT